MIFRALLRLVQAEEAGIIEELGYRWRREVYSEPEWPLLNRE
ncbi:MAG: hypothetical protein ACOYL7_19130 [Caldilinea sp.]